MKVGDRVSVDGMSGIVVCDADAGKYSNTYPAAEWAEVLKTGLLVLTKEVGLIHLPERSRAVPEGK